MLTAFAVPFVCAGSAFATAPRPAADLASWAVLPDSTSCHADLELTGRSGAVTPLTLTSDGERVMLRFAMEAAPERAFLPIRVDQKAYANLVLRGDAPGLAVMTLSDETLAALRKGKTLQIAWLSEEAVRGALAGANQGIADLKVCGAQVTSRWRADQQARSTARVRADADARAQAVASEQLAVVRAHRLAAEAESRRRTAEAQRAAAEAERLSAQAAQERAYAEQSRQRAQATYYPQNPYAQSPYAYAQSPYPQTSYYDDRRYQPPRYYEDEAPPAYAYRRYYPR